MIEPLRLEFRVEAPVEDAWAVWTERFGQWWPTDHTATGRDDLLIVLERHLGGRIYERTPEGDEHDWGQVTVWEPPSRLAYSWHLRRDRADATDVEIRFIDRGSVTDIRIEHRGWERLGGDGETWRDRNRGGWSTLLPHYLEAAGGGSTVTISIGGA